VCVRRMVGVSLEWVGLGEKEREEGGRKQVVLVSEMTLCPGCC